MSKERVLALQLDPQGSNPRFLILDSEGRILTTGPIPKGQYLAGAEGDAVMARSLQTDSLLTPSNTYFGSPLPNFNLHLYNGFVMGFSSTAGLFIQPPDGDGVLIPDLDKMCRVAVDPAFHRIVATKEYRVAAGPKSYDSRSLVVDDWSGRRLFKHPLNSRYELSSCLDHSMAYLDQGSVAAVFAFQFSDSERARLPKLGTPSPLDGYDYCICRVSIPDGLVSPIVIVKFGMPGDMAVPFRDTMVVLRKSKQIFYCDGDDHLYRYGYGAAPKPAVAKPAPQKDVVSLPPKARASR